MHKLHTIGTTAVRKDLISVQKLIILDCPICVHELYLITDLINWRYGGIIYNRNYSRAQRSDTCVLVPVWKHPSNKNHIHPKLKEHKINIYSYPKEHKNNIYQMTTHKPKGKPLTQRKTINPKDNQKPKEKKT